MSVFLFPNRIKDTDFSVTRQVIALLDQHGIHALLADELAGELVDTKAVFLPQQQALAQAKQVITIGGDGTLLRIAHDCLAQSKPVLGVNLGRIGFLATCEVAELRKSWPAWLRGGIPLSRATCCARMPRPITGTRLP